MTAPDEIKAGKYELVALFWEQPKSKPGEPYDYTRHVQGAVVDLNVEDARRLVTAGAVVKPGELQRRAAEAARQAYQQSLLALPPDVRAEMDVDESALPTPDPSVAPTGTSTEPTAAVVAPADQPRADAPSRGAGPAGRART